MSSSKRPVRRRSQPRWVVDYDVSSGHLKQDQWAVKRLVDVKDVEDGSGAKREAFLVEWEGDFESTWVASDDVFGQLKEEFWAERKAAKSNADVVIDVMEGMLDTVEKKMSRRRRTQLPKTEPQNKSERKANVQKDE